MKWSNLMMTLILESKALSVLAMTIGWAVLKIRRCQLMKQKILNFAKCSCQLMKQKILHIAKFSCQISFKTYSNLFYLKTMNRNRENFQAQAARNTPFSPPRMGSSGPRMFWYPDASRPRPMLGSKKNTYVMMLI